MINKIADGERLAKILKERKISQTRLSEMTGIHLSTVNRAIKSISLNTEDIKKICEALDIEIWEFFIDKKDLAKMCKVSPEMLEIVQTIEQLPPDIQNTLLNAFNSFIDALLQVAGRKQNR